MNVVWLKKDLRLSDHAPLYHAIADGRPFVLVFCFEPSISRSPTFDVRHWWFIYGSIAGLQTALRPFGVQVHVFYNEVLTIFSAIHHLCIYTDNDNNSEKNGIEVIFSHQETGVAETYARDKQVKQFCRDNGIEWREYPDNGIVRGLKSLEGWQKTWETAMRHPTYHVNLRAIRTKVPNLEALEAYCNLNELPMGVRQAAYGFAPELNFQQYNEQFVNDLLQSFITSRSRQYAANYALAEAGRYSNSRLSVYLTYGNISLRQVFHALRQHSPNRNLSAFKSRLAARARYIQLFEMEDRIAFENLNFAFNGIRIKTNPAYFEAWAVGQTGYPLVDAAMRCLKTTGYLNFNLRALLVSFLTHHLWQDWRKGGADYLARQFLDFEPGVHYAQIQIQAACAGIYSFSISNPIKQSREEDANAVFIKKWVPELAEVPPELCHTPWQMSVLEQQWYGCIMGKNYPKPIVDCQKTYFFAMNELTRVKNSNIARQETERLAARYLVR